ncbi:kunitz trypsin inhibitor 3-like [Solanum lycopersicum]|uniref:Uncharacterized protein n=1 Tax=Solanum lycopersicum TaxID=4081 RepID=A0A3Q7GDM0_SOLLC|nr:kunitz-type serine protease inhibitor DrTI-like [Solanum lycopersicum]
MKSVVLVISIFVVAFWCSCTNASPNQGLLKLVYDINGEILRSDTRYFVVSEKIRTGVVRGPVLFNGDANIVCPFQVMQSPREFDRGMSVYFKPKAPKQVEITESSDVNIEFDLGNPTVCNNNVWMVEGFPLQSDNPMYLSTNGKAGYVASWFQIKEVEGNNSTDYKLMFCHYGDENICTDIGIDHTSGRLAIRTGNTFNVVFIKDPFIGII